MKKTIFSALFVSLFGFYAIAQRTNAVTAINPIAPTKTNEVAVVTDAPASDTSTNSQPVAPIAQVSQRIRNEDDREVSNDDESEKRVIHRTPQPTAPIAAPAQKPVVVPTPTPPPTPAPAPVAVAPTNKKYNDGTFTGPSSNAYYGYVQVQVTTKNDRIVAVAVLDYPQDRRTSVQINSQALPILKSEVISAQNAQIDTVSGATDTSDAFIQSLTAALSQASV